MMALRFTSNNELIYAWLPVQGTLAEKRSGDTNRRHVFHPIASPQGRAQKASWCVPHRSQAAVISWDSSWVWDILGQPFSPDRSQCGLEGGQSLVDILSRMGGGNQERVSAHYVNSQVLETAL